jgi:hypothetical protein
VPRSLGRGRVRAGVGRTTWREALTEARSRAAVTTVELDPILASTSYEVKVRLLTARHGAGVIGQSKMPAAT